jgi:hypothetical protein
VVLQSRSERTSLRVWLTVRGGRAGTLAVRRLNSGRQTCQNGLHGSSVRLPEVQRREEKEEEKQGQERGCSGGCIGRENRDPPQCLLARVSDRS